MRIISGSRRGAKLITREGIYVRPTTDRVKESMFNLITGFFPRGTVLDLFAGSGALSIEALSRGADRAVCVDVDAESLNIVKRNYENVGFSHMADFVLKEAQTFLRTSSEKFDIVFLDPPYNMGLIEPVMKLLHERSAINNGGVVVLESDSIDELPEFAGFSVMKQRRYGRTLITLYEKEVI